LSRTIRDKQMQKWSPLIERRRHYLLDWIPKSVQPLLWLGLAGTTHDLRHGCNNAAEKGLGGIGTTLLSLASLLTSALMAIAKGSLDAKLVIASLVQRTQISCDTKS
jgi:hypothetical protein